MHSDDPLVQVYTNMQRFCERAEECGSRPPGECLALAPRAAVVEAALETLAWGEQQREQCSAAIEDWETCALGLSCNDFVAMDDSIYVDGTWLCIHEGRILGYCTEPLQCEQLSVNLLTACGELDDAVDALADSPEAALASSTAIPGVVLIDDGEDKDNRTLQGRPDMQGFWYTFDDRCECDNPDPAQGTVEPLPEMLGGYPLQMTSYVAGGIPAAPLEGTQSDNHFGLQVTGGGHLLFGGGVGVALANFAGSPSSFDLAAMGWRSLRFQMRNGLTASSPQVVEVLITDSYSEPQGEKCIERPVTESPCLGNYGTECSPNGCFDAPRVTVTSTSEWQTFELPLTEFVREGIGLYEGDVVAPQSLDLTTAYQVQFRVPAGTPQFDLWIDNVGFAEE